MELNPNHKTTSTLHDHWHKIAALLMLKMGVTKTIITTDEIARLNQGINIAIRDTGTCLEIFIVDDEEAARLARKEGGLPV